MTPTLKTTPMLNTKMTNDANNGVDFEIKANVKTTPTLKYVSTILTILTLNDIDVDYLTNVNKQADVNTPSTLKKITDVNKQALR